MTFKLYVDDNHSIYTEERLIKRFFMDDPDFKNSGRPRLDQRYYDFYDSHIVEKNKDYYSMVKDNPGVAFIGYQAPRMTAKDWQISADTATVAGVLCMKATTALGGRDRTAWFSTEIPISDGPYKFSGLPGLIMKISSDDGDYDFEIREIKRLGADDYFIHQVDYRLISEKRFKETFDKRITNPFEYYFKGSGGTPDMIINLNGKEITAMEESEMTKKSNLNKNTIEKFKSK